MLTEDFYSDLHVNEIFVRNFATHVRETVLTGPSLTENPPVETNYAFC